MTARVGVVLFPGTNCEHDVAAALAALGGEPVLVWHGERSLGDVDAVVLPGGFAHGDYLRPGAIARFSPVMGAVQAFAAAGGPVVGICNGFQVLTEAGLLPGALQKNAGLAFLCAPAPLIVASSASVLTGGLPVGTELTIPVNHFEGNYTVDDPAALESLHVVLRYAANPNGSMGDIAGVANAAGNVVGLMPHPERACDPLVGRPDGAVLLAALLTAAGSGAVAGGRAALAG
ncbi:MAG TPA: phosphoribosylformylglycinamidine synthase subunit PurQ [Acidimicrobiales bacterium]|nr:phosphoribosylformylglycinamidine synthase subunit PurQ [Acidimicrobiales bacterium]